ncbi:hypothetical protein HK104_011048 [Borealophlyctis nickersoniae]|nr:hypothetical protein HK104_011048 [Borealophlyctis nickersoniae]
MKLFYTTTSPYARMVLASAREVGVFDQLALHISPVSPLKTDLPVQAHNPLAQIPTLVLQDGTALYDSRVICEYLDALAGGALFPRDMAPGSPRWGAIRRLALAEGITNAAVQCFYENNVRGEQYRSPEWVEAQWKKVDRGLDAFEEEAKQGKLPPPEEMTIGEVAIVCAFGWIKLRFADKIAARPRPALEKWIETYECRPAFIATRP